jgi:hypothetical protein
MGATYRILPDPGYRDGLGSLAQPWEEIHGREIFLDGKPVASRPIDAGWIEAGTLPPQRVSQLLPETILTGSLRSLSAISADAALGAGDPTARINAGLTLLLGSKIADNSLRAAALNPETNWPNMITVVPDGGLKSSDWDGNVGWILDGNTPFFKRGVWSGTIEGASLIFMGGFSMNGDGRAHVGHDPGIFAPSPLGFTWDETGRLWFGTIGYDEAPTQFDRYGNFFLTDTLESLSSIDLGAINAFVRGVTPNVASGGYSGNVAFQARTRGADIYYTDDGSDPSDVTNPARTLYTGPVNVNPGAGAPVTIKTVAYKLGVQGGVEEWVYTYPPDPGGAVSSPTFTPPGDYYYPSNGVMIVQLVSATAGATIRYTLDGTDPTGASAVYVGPLNLPVGATTIKAFAQKAGLADSLIRNATFIVSEGANIDNTGETPPDGGSGRVRRNIP